MIVLLSCSTNLLASKNDTISSTGRQDSTLVSYADLRKVNSKLIELEYERDINEHLRTIINNDSIAINSLRDNISRINISHKRDMDRVKKQRNVAGCVGIGAVILLIISIL